MIDGLLDFISRIEQEAGSNAEDEHAMALGLEYMLSMCGNQGQMTIVSNGSESYYFWGMGAAEEEGHDDDFASYENEIRSAIDTGRGEWAGTHLIWEEGFSFIENQYGKRDNFDEQGEGEGR